MSIRIDWRIGPARRPAPAAHQPPGQRGRRVGVQLLLVLLYAAALVAAGWVGFGIGRWSDARSTIRREIEHQLAVEDLAWQQADLDLFSSTIDPHSARRQELIASFLASAPQTMAVELRRLEVETARQVTVELLIQAGGTSHVEQRQYIRRQDTWYRAP